MTQITDFSSYSAMQEGKPYKRYIKKILGKVYVTALNPFNGEPEGIILVGDPRDKNNFYNVTVDVWDVKQDQFFKRMNANHFKSGNIEEFIPKEDEDVTQQISPNVISDDEIHEILDKPFLALKNKLNSFTETAPVYRVLAIAEEKEKSEKILAAIRARAAELELEGVSLK